MEKCCCCCYCLLDHRSTGTHLQFENVKIRFLPRRKFISSPLRRQICECGSGQCSLLSKAQYLFSPSKHSGNTMYQLLGNSAILRSSHTHTHTHTHTTHTHTTHTHTPHTHTPHTHTHTHTLYLCVRCVADISTAFLTRPNGWS